MPVIWLAPIVLLGLALVTVPIAIHLLVRQQSRRVEFPSLRFLRPSQLAAFRRRHIQDALLLACRAGIVAAAVMALAGPVVQTAYRSTAYGARTARAIVLLPGADPDSAAEASLQAYASRTFARERVSDAIADAARWLAAQPPASLEVLFVGAFARGSITAGDLGAIPDSAGIRFVPVAGPVAARDVTVPVLAARPGAGDGRLVVEQRQVLLADTSTRVAIGEEAPAARDALRIIAAPADQRLADAALRAALVEGLRWRGSSQRVLVAWTGADEAVVLRELNGALLVRMERPEPASTAASALVQVVEQVSAEPLGALEPVTISEEQLQAWSRPAGAVPADVRPVDEGDRRWLWAFALALLGAEYWLRRARPTPAAIEPAAEARVA